MVKIITIDLDGTLFDSMKKISDENKEAIRLAREKGIKVVIATGRPFNGVKPVLEELNINSDDDYVICYNGAKCFNVKTGELVASSTITGKEVKEIFNESQRLGTYFHAFRQNEELIVHEKNEYSDVETRINKITETITLQLVHVAAGQTQEAGGVPLALAVAAHQQGPVLGMGDLSACGNGTGGYLLAV